MDLSSLIFNFSTISAAVTADKITVSADLPEIIANPPAVPSAATNKRCPTCRHKIALTDFACKCGPKFCAVHRLPEAHACTFDFRERDRVNLQQQLVKVVADKMGGDRIK